MKKKFSMLKNQLLLSLISILGIMLVIISIVINNSMLQIIFDNTEKVRLNSFNEIRKELLSMQRSTENIAQIIFVDPLIKDFCQNIVGMDGAGVEKRREIGRFFDKLLLLNPGIYSIFLEANNGNLLGTERNFNYNNSAEKESGRTQKITDSTNEMWELVRYNDVQSLIYPEASKRVFAISFSMDFIDVNYSANIKICIEEKYLYNIISGYADSPKSNIYLCNENGTIMLSSDAEKIGKQVSLVNGKILGNKGSFTDKGLERQIIFNEFPEIGWTVVEEIPVKQYIYEVSSLQNKLVIMLTILIAVVLLMGVVFIRKLTYPLKLLMGAMENMRKGNIGCQITHKSNNEFGQIIECFNSMSLETQKLIQNNIEMEKQKNNYAISALRSQINPHFIFNTINTIKWMAVINKSNNIKDALEKLSILLKPLFKERDTSITINDEIAYLDNYIQLINLRFGEQIAFIVNISEEILQSRIPRFILQPVIENCVEHAFEGNYQNAKIEVNCSTLSETVLTISDNGLGISDQKLKQMNMDFRNANGIVENGERIGLANVNMCLKMLYGSKYGIEIQNNDLGGTTVAIKLPKLLE